MNRSEINFKKLRREYRITELSEEMLPADPLKFFSTWFKVASQAGMIEPNAMCLATANKQGYVNARMVLLKGYDKTGFDFYTHYNSIKATEIKSNQQAALVFYWDRLERQVRITGKIKKLSRVKSAKYFASRPRSAQIGAWASAQSATLVDREALAAKIVQLNIKYRGKKIPLPPHWGGYCLVPQKIEFWQGRENRLHDRFEYSKAGRSWKIRRLYP